MMKSGSVIVGATVVLMALSGCTTLSKEDAARLDKASADSAQALSTANRADENAKAAQASAAAAESSAKVAESHAEASAAAAKESAATAQAMREATEHMEHHHLRK